MDAGFYAGSLEPGEYQGQIILTTNDIHNPQVAIPATMRILADDLSIVPKEGFVFQGPEFGPFVPDSTSYTLTNTGSAPLDWSISWNESWLEAAPANGSLEPGASIVVTARLQGSAQTMLAGSYADSLRFTNQASGVVQNLQIRLEILVVPGEISVTDSIIPESDSQMPFGDVIMGLSRTEYVTVSNSDPLHSLLITNISLGGAVRRGLRGRRSAGLA